MDGCVLIGWLEGGLFIRQHELTLGQVRDALIDDILKERGEEPSLFEKAEKGAMYLWHLAYDRGWRDKGNGHYKMVPPSATELAKEAGLLEKVIVEKAQGDHKHS